MTYAREVGRKWWFLVKNVDFEKRVFLSYLDGSASKKRIFEPANDHFQGYFEVFGAIFPWKWPIFGLKNLVFLEYRFYMPEARFLKFCGFLTSLNAI